MQRVLWKPLHKDMPDEERIALSQRFYQSMNRRRTVREFSSQSVPREIIENCILTAGTAPNGANLQPWSFVVVESLEMKQKIRKTAEAEERIFYSEKISEEWADDLKPLKTSPDKRFLEEAPYLIAVFNQIYGFNPDGSKKKHYYTTESVGIATGFLITALHQCGLGVLTYTPPQMQFLARLLNRSDNERAFMLLVTGFPKKNVEIPDLERKPLNRIVTFH